MRIMRNTKKTLYRLSLTAAVFLMANTGTAMAQLPSVTGHRAGATIAPENTVQALETSIRYGIDYAEIDVSQTSDGVLILLHDNNLYRTTGINKNVWEVSWGEIHARNKSQKSGPCYERNQIPRLSTAMETVNGKMKLNIELKHTGQETADYVDRVLGLINNYGMHDQCVITSFHYPYLERVKQLLPNVKTGYISSDPHIDFNSYPAADCFSLDQTILTQEIVDTIHSSGRQVYAWTVNDRASILNCLTLGVDNIIGDDPAYIKRVIGA